jgi:hypothetical protein
MIAAFSNIINHKITSVSINGNYNDYRGIEASVCPSAPYNIITICLQMG